MLKRSNSLFPAFTLIEILVVVAIVSLLISLLLPVLSSARNAGLCSKCMSNLRASAQAAATMAAEDAQGILHHAPNNADGEWRGLGAWDWGGADGADDDFRERNANYHLGAVTRPINRALFGDRLSKDSDYSMFRCPGDEGQVPGLQYGGADQPSIESMFASKGNSYQGDFIWFDETINGKVAALRFGTFMRPSNMIPETGQTILFYEARFPQAFLHTTETSRSRSFPGHQPANVWGSHRDLGVFNVSFADSHVEKIRVLGNGTMANPLMFDGRRYPYRTSMIRGKGWRYDTQPEPMMVETGGGKCSGCCNPPPGQLVLRTELTRR